MEFCLFLIPNETVQIHFSDKFIPHQTNNDEFN